LGTGLDHQRVEVHPSLQDSCDVKSITILDWFEVGSELYHRLTLLLQLLRTIYFYKLFPLFGNVFLWQS
jgi:hypothetical protein